MSDSCLYRGETGSAMMTVSDAEPGSVGSAPGLRQLSAISGVSMLHVTYS